MAQALNINGLQVVVDTDRGVGPARQDLADVCRRFPQASSQLPQRVQKLTADHCVTALLLLPCEHQTVAVMAEILKASPKAIWRKIAPLKKRLGITQKAHFMRLLAGKMETEVWALGQRPGYDELAERVGAYLRQREEAPAARKKLTAYPGRDALVQAIKELAPSAGHRALAAKLGCTQPAISSKDGWLNRTFGCTDLKALRAQLSGASPAVDQQG